ncbi:SRPBCC family protein [Saccharopolyspora sp. K220]|uniref:SRPBCC family protein n=1 Tax=Saccharopolyspora soli TaxID=2926618 RepID=UPI001F5852E2|nr:SRPBCC family protein [Saccharopolyspora soli]MCI2422254.1 SRPBCC family protein [Saccharopolyspora soli]
MQLSNSFTVPVPVETAWSTLLDVERIAPCMPGAAVDRVDGNDVLGSVTVKLGPIMMRYQGTMTFTERDEASHRAVLTASAKEVRGGGFVNATIAATLAPADDGTEVSVVTDLDVTGKAAQFGRNVLSDVSSHLVGQFADNLAGEIRSGGGKAAGDPAPATPSGERSGAAAPPATPNGGASLNALELLKAPARRLLPPVLTGVIIGVVIGRLSKRRTR